MTMPKLRQFIITASARRGGIRLGTYEAPSPAEALEMAKRERGQWAAVELQAEEYELRFEIEEDFL
jgi:hypothetical protein